MESGELEAKSADVARNSSSLLLVVKEHTRGFRETNVNIMKAVIQLFMTMIEYHESKEKEFVEWAMQDGVSLAVQKISDRKLSSGCKNLLTEMCVVCMPASVVAEVSSSVKGIKSPVVHEEALRWFQSFCEDFGAASLGQGLSELIPWILDVSCLDTERRWKISALFDYV